MVNTFKHPGWWVLGVLAIGLVAIGPASAKVEGDTIVLGAAVSLTGKYSTNGMNTQDGYELGVKRINEMGGVRVGGKYYRIKVLYYDDESTPARGAQLAERLIKQDGVKFMLGPYSSGLTKAIAPVTEKYQIPMVQGNGADRGLFTQGYKYMFAVLSTSDQYLREAINLAAEQAQKQGKDPKTLKVAMAFENDNFSLDVRDGVLEDAKRWGMKVVVDDKLPPELNDLQDNSVFPDITVEENLWMGGFLMERPAQAKAAAENIFGTYPLLAERRRQRAGTLSGGERRLLEIARALVMEPQVLLIDEPSIGLEPRYIGMVFEVLDDLQRRQGKTIVMVEQNAKKGLQFSDIGYVLVSGEIAMAGTGDDLLRDPEVGRLFLGA